LPGATESAGWVRSGALLLTDRPVSNAPSAVWALQNADKRIIVGVSVVCWMDVSVEWGWGVETVTSGMNQGEWIGIKD
jgi:hypothetical protein